MNRHTLDFNKNIVSLDDSVIWEFEEQTFVAFGTAYVFSINSDSIADLVHARVFSCKIYNGDTLIRDFKPCREGVDGAYCLYDEISKKYYHNYGTGSFTGGNMQTPKELEYIESTGTQYIDTGIKGSVKNRIELDLQYVGDVGRFQINGLTYSNSMRNDIGLNNSNVFWGVSTNSVTSETAGDNERHTYFIDCTDGSYGIDGLTIGNVTPATAGDTTLSVFLGARKKTDTVEGFCYEKIFGGKYYIDGTLVRNFVPYKDEYGVICLYDKVNNKKYYNAGTGEFLEGPVNTRR